jgi:hypothetical protein
MSFRLKSRIPLTPVVGAICVTSSIGWSATRTWDGGGSTSDASEAANWSGEVVPSSTDDIVLDGTSTKAMTWNAGVNGLPSTVNSWTQSGAPTTVTMPIKYSGAFAGFTVTGNLSIGTGTWKHSAYADGPDTPQERLNVTVNGAFVLGSSASIDLNGLGYDADDGPGAGTNFQGGGYGGAGGRFSNSTYGGDAGDGGGHLRLNVLGAATVNGTITATGIAANGSGAGGGINLTAASLSGGGTLTVRGGTTSSTNAAGGGGRIAVVLTGPGSTFSSFTGSIIATGGDGSDSLEDGAAGTIYQRTGGQTTGQGVLRIINFSGANTHAEGFTDLPPVNGSFSDDLSQIDVVMGSTGKLRVRASLELQSVAVPSGTTLLLANGVRLTLKSFTDAGGVAFATVGTYTDNTSGWFDGVTFGTGSSIVIVPEPTSLSLLALGGLMLLPRRRRLV